MKKILLGLLLFVAGQANAALSDSDLQQNSFINDLKSGGFENGKAGWTSSNGTFTITTSTFTAGGNAANISLSSNTGDLISQSVTPTHDTANINYEASCKVKTSLTTIQVCSLAGGVEQQCVAVSAANTWGDPVRATMVGPANGTSVGVKIKATSSSTGTVNADECYVGPLRTAGPSAPQPILLGSVKITACSVQWSQTSTSYASFGGSPTGCVYTTTGNAQAPASNLPAIKFASVPSGGDLRLEYEGQIKNPSNTDMELQFTDGTTTAKEESTVSGSGSTIEGFPGISQTMPGYAGGTNVTFEIKSKVTANTGNIAGTTGNPGVIKVWWFPSQSQQVLNSNQSAASITLSSTLTGSTTSATFADPGTVSGTVTTLTSRNITCTATASKVGIDCTLPKTGNYMVCYSGYMTNSGTNGSNARLVDGSANVIVGQQAANISTSGGAAPMGSCGTYNVTSISSATTFKVQANATAGTTSVFPTTFSVTQLDVGTPAPLINGSISSNSTSAFRLEFVDITNNATTCAASTPSSMSITGVSRSALGTCTGTFSTSWTSTPACWCQISPNAAGTGNINCNVNAVSTTTFTTKTYATNTSANHDDELILYCIGSR